MNLSCYVTAAFVAIGVLLASLVMPPKSEPIAVDADTLDVVSFNIRYEGVEAHEHRLFSNRLKYIANFVDTTGPWLVGLQEALPGQVVRLQERLPRFGIIGYQGDGHDALAMSDTRRKHDFHTSILFDREKLVLVAHDHVWLSDTPRVEGSKSWGSKRPRTLTIAAFRLKDAAGVNLVMFNTHLDVHSARARAEQARHVGHHVRAWRKTYPKATFLATGDFNSLNGQRPHQLMLESSLVDAWDACGADSSCALVQFPVTFHGWFGGYAGSYVARVPEFILFTLHGSGIEMPTSVPESIAECFEMIRVILSQLPSMTGLWQALPQSLTRMHVDWIFFDGAKPLSVFVGDVRRDGAHSSDHFPVVARFALSSVSSVFGCDTALDSMSLCAGE